MFAKHGNDALVIEGFRKWSELVAEERQSFGDVSNNMFTSDLCSGLFRLPNLRSVKLDNEMWRFNRTIVSIMIPRLKLDRCLGGIFQFSGSPLVRSWNPLHLRPKKPPSVNFGFHDHLAPVMRALAETNRKIEGFDCGCFRLTSLSPRAFDYSIPARLPRHIVDALWQLKSFTLSITPLVRKVLDDQNSETLGFLPHLLQQMVGLKHLELTLLTAEGMALWLNSTSVNLIFPNECYKYSQIFPQRGRWPSLNSLWLRGLAIDGLDLIFLLCMQMPRLQCLRLSHIDLQGRWEGVVEGLRLLGKRWGLLGLQRLFRHCNGQWWPCTPDQKEEERSKLHEMIAYIENGGRHPNLPNQCHDSQSTQYYQDMSIGATWERQQAFWQRISEANELRGLR